MTSKSTSWRQQYKIRIFWRQSYTMTSKIRHEVTYSIQFNSIIYFGIKFHRTWYDIYTYLHIKNMEGMNKIYDVKMYVMMLKSVWRHKIRYETSIRHDVQNTAWHQSQTVMHYVKRYVMTPKSSSWRQKYTMMSKSSQWHQNVRWDIKNASW